MLKPAKDYATKTKINVSKVSNSTQATRPTCIVWVRGFRLEANRGAVATARLVVTIVRARRMPRQASGNRARIGLGGDERRTNLGLQRIDIDGGGLAVLDIDGEKL